MKTILLIIGLVYLLGGCDDSSTGYTGDTSTQRTYDVDNCIDEIVDETGMSYYDARQTGRC